MRTLSKVLTLCALVFFLGNCGNSVSFDSPLLHLGVVPIKVTDATDAPIKGATVAILQTGVTPREIKEYQTYTALTDANKQTCDDPTVPFFSAGCTDKDGKVSLGCVLDSTNNVQVLVEGSASSFGIDCTKDGVTLKVI